MADLKRVNFFNFQLLDEQDFKSEQAYHRDARYRNNLQLFSPGIITGLEARRTGDRQVTVSAGFAIDKTGKEIVLSADQPYDLETTDATGSFFITLQLEEADADPYTGPGVTGKVKRILERPKLGTTKTVPADPILVLAQVTLDANAITTVNSFPSQRLTSGLDETRLSAAVRGKLVLNGNNHDHVGGDGAQIKHSNLLLDGGTNPHKTTAADIDGSTNEIVNRINAGNGVINQAKIDSAIARTNAVLPLTGGTLSGSLTVNGTINATNYLRNGAPLSTTQWSDIAGGIAYTAGNVGIGITTPYTQLTLTGTLGFTNATVPMMYIFQSGTTNPDRPIISHSPSNLGWGLLYRDNGDLMIFQSNGTPVMTIDLANQRVGVGNTTTPAFTLEVIGSAGKPGGGSWSASSDIRLKQNVQPLQSVLERLLKLQGVSFEWKEPAKQGNLFGRQIGMIAQDVETVFPDWVSTGSDGYKTLTFRGFEALTVEALRELKTENETLKATCRSLEARLKILEAKLQAVIALNQPLTQSL